MEENLSLKDSDKENVITFPSGLIGLDHLKKFLLFGSDDLPFRWLQAVNEKKETFVVLQPGLIKTDYHVEIQDDALHVLNFKEGDDVVILCPVRIPEGSSQHATMNMQGPILINCTRNIGVQIILNESYPLRFPLTGNEAGLSKWREEKC